jgi:flagellar basal body-associated protein FliL
MNIPQTVAKLKVTKKKRSSQWIYIKIAILLVLTIFIVAAIVYAMQHLFSMITRYGAIVEECQSIKTDGGRRFCFKYRALDTISSLKKKHD